MDQNISVLHFLKQKQYIFNYIGAPSGQHHLPCATPAVEKFTVVKKIRIYRPVLKHCFNLLYTIQKPWTVVKGFKIKLGKQHSNKYRNCLF